MSMKNTGIIITGTAKGIGLTLSAHFSQLGMHVFAADLDEINGRQAAEQTNAKTDSGGKVEFVKLDVTNAEEVETVFARLLQENPQIVKLINNVGATEAETYEMLDGKQWDKEMSVNLNSAYYCCRAVLPAFKQTGGSILCIGSVNGLSFYGNPAYSAAKAALHNMVFSMAAEYGPHGVRVNAICPGSVKTDAWQKRLRKNPRLMESLLKHYPLGKLVRPQDIAYAAEFLLSERATAISGVLLPVDCGLTVGNIKMAAEIAGQSK